MTNVSTQTMAAKLTSVQANNTQHVPFKSANRQRSKDLNRENYLRILQVAIHADSDKLWNKTVWYW